MTTLIRLYDRLVDAMAVLAAAMLVWPMVSIIVSVLMRNAGLQPFAWLFTSTEYAILYMTMLGAPWLVRKKGHVHIELVTAILPPATQRLLSRMVAASCVAVCAILAWKGIDLVATNIARNDVDMRAFIFPRWLLTVSFPLSFGLMAIEFARFTFGRDLLHSGQAGIHE